MGPPEGFGLVLSWNSYINVIEFYLFFAKCQGVGEKKEKNR
jgi:hypothetical protein